MANYIETRCKRVMKRIVRAEQLDAVLRFGVLLEKQPIMKEGVLHYEVKFTKYLPISYENLVHRLVKEQYSDSAEFAILRKSITNPNNAEYLQYNAYVEDCKVQARAYIDERIALFGK